MLIKIHRKQKGQSIPLGIALFLVLGLMSIVLFNTGQTVSDKSRLVNTADSAVYSGLLWQARAMNFQAYTNRAMVANQVAMAQAVSINSWSGYIAKAGENLDLAFGWIPYVGVVTKIIYNLSKGIDTILNPISKGMLSVVNAVNASLSVAQEAMYYAAFVSTPDVVNSVVKSNEPEHQKFKWATAFSVVNVGLNWKEWNDFTESSDVHQDLAETERFNMINASLDKFSKERKWRFFNFFIPITPLNWVRFEKAGTTKLVRHNGKYEWFAKDALSLREKRYTWRGRKYSDIPIAGASSLANTEDSHRTIMGDDPSFFGGRHSVAQSRDWDFGGFGFHAQRSMKHYGGIHAYRSLSKELREQPEPPTMKLRIQVSMKTGQVMDSDVLVNDEQYKASVETPGDVLSSVSTAEMYFEKPCFDTECVEEYANGYSPYWDVRLSNTSGLLRLAAHTTQANVLTDSLASRDSSLERLPYYDSSLANPLTDYKEQVKGVRVVLSQMDRHLISMVQDSDQYRAYESKINEIRDNISFELDGIASEFQESILSEEEIIDEITKAAGIDLALSEYAEIEREVTRIYGALTDVGENGLDMLETEVRGYVGDKVEELKAEVKNELTQILKNAVRNILAGMVASFIEQKTGLVIPGDVIDEASEDIAASAVSGAQNLANNSADAEDDDIRIDATNECTMYESINQSEREVEDMQRRLEAINTEIAIKFNEELVIETNAAVARRLSLEASIAVLGADIVEINKSSMNEEATEDAVRAKRDQIRHLQTAYDAVPDDRVEKLTTKLMTISDNATRSEFPEYNLERRFAKRAVTDTLGNINNLQVDENGDPVTDNLFTGDADAELASDTEQSLTEKPEGC